MRRLSNFPALVIGIVGVLVIAACAPQGARIGIGKPVPGTAPTTGAAAKPVKVALLAPLSAANPGAAALGEALVNSARMAAADVNDPRLQLAVYDTAGDPATAAQSARRAVSEGAGLIIGPLFSSTTDAVRSVAAKNRIKVISFSTDRSAAGGPVYLSGFLPENAARRVIGFARSRGYDTLGIIYPETPYGQVALAGAVAAAGPALVVSQGYRRTQQGIGPAAADFAERVRATGVRAVMIAESGQALDIVASALSERGIDGFSYRYLGLGEWNSRSTLQSTSLHGGWFAAPDPEAMQAFVEKYRTAYGSVPPALAVLGYDAVQIAADLMAFARTVNSPDPFSAAALTRPQGFRGAVGPIRFTRNGLSERGLTIQQISAAGLATIDRAPVTFGAGT